MKTKKELEQKKVKTVSSYNQWFFYVLLCVLVIAVYSPSLNNGFTELDDSIFIKENLNYNKDISNLATSFDRGVFAVKKDTYYRPMLLNSYILNYQIGKDNIRSYHFWNLLFHLFSVLLLWRLLLRLSLPKRHALLLAILFAVHPVLSQAVSWIPGRNDTLLAIFCFGFLLATIDYLQKKRWISLGFAFLLLLLALFTKESAIFFPFGAFLVFWMMEVLSWKEKRAIPLYCSWFLAVVLWFVVRSMADLQSTPMTIPGMASNFISRVPVLILYFGKCFLPFNLSVFPILQDSSCCWGFTACMLVAALIYFAGENNKRIIIAGFGWFLLMLLPVVLLPASLNEQDFEHRLYVPMFGILLVLSQTALFTRLKESIAIAVILCIVILFAGINILQQKKFSSPLVFWEEAAQSSPHSAYATMMYAARLDNREVKRARELMLKAYSLNSKEKYINFYLGKMYNDEGDWDNAGKFLLAELTTSAYYETYFQLSRVEIEKKHLDKAILYMETYLQKAPSDQLAINNYILMLIDANQKQKALNFIRQKQKNGLEIPPELINKANSGTNP